MSRDGRRLAYESKEQNRFDVYIQPYPGPGGKMPISTEGGAEPQWSWNGRQLFYRRQNKEEVWAVDVRTACHMSCSWQTGTFAVTSLRDGLNTGVVSLVRQGTTFPSI